MKSKKVYELLPFMAFIAIGVDLTFGLGPAAITFGLLGLLAVGIWGGGK